jgi:uncharacterized RDD family membrane protein YckC
MATQAPVAPRLALDIHVTGRRILAIIVDALLLGLLFSPIYVLFDAISGDSVSASLEVLQTLIYSVGALLYFTLLEGYAGQTVGKMLLGIKVVREDNGEVPGLGTAALRTVLRIIDGLFGYLVGFIAVMTSAKRQRLGDMAAHTLVVHK